MLKSLHLSNVGPAPEMKLDLGSRVNLITGDNGLGKSFLLDVAWWALTRKWPQDVNTKLTSGYVARPTDPKKPATITFALDAKTKPVVYESRYVARDESWQGKAGRPHNPGLVVYAHADGSFSVWDPARNYWKKKGNVDVQDRLPAYVFSPKEVWDGLFVKIDDRPVPVCNGLLADWTRWIFQDSVEAGNMATVLAALSPPNDPAGSLVPGPVTRISVFRDARDIPSLRTGYSDAVPILHASSGVRRIVALAYMLLWTWHEHLRAATQLGVDRARQVILIVDELESHLHPRWQRSILRSLMHLTSSMHVESRLQIVAATHSPLVLMSAEPFFDPEQDAWFDLDFVRNGKKGQVELARRTYCRHGSASNWLTSEAFDLKEARSLDAEEAVTRALGLYRSRNPSKKDVAEVDGLLRKALGDTDKFWLRWSEFRERHGVHA